MSQAVVKTAVWNNNLISGLVQFQNEAENGYCNLKIGHDQNPPQNDDLLL